MAAQRDPYYIVKDEVGETVRRATLVLCQPPPTLPPAAAQPTTTSCRSPLAAAFHLQLRSAQAKFGRWQALPHSSADKKALRAELEEDCGSLEYMVRAGGGGRG